MKLAGWVILILALVLVGIFGLIDFAAIFSALVAHPRIVFECFILVTFSVAFAAMRLAALLKLVGISVAYLDVLKITMLALFSGAILVGPIGAEVARFGMLVKKCEHRHAELTAVLLFDRILGLFGMGCVVFFMSLLAAEVSERVPYHHYLAAAVLVVFATLVLPFIMYKHISMRRKQVVKEYVRNRAPGLCGIFFQLGLVFRASRNVVSRPLMLFKLVGFSVFASLLPLIGFSEVIKALLPNTFNFSSCVMILAITILFNSIGITPGGLGVGESVFALLCFLVTQDSSLPYVETFLTIRLISIMCVLPGGVFLLWALQQRKL